MKLNFGDIIDLLKTTFKEWSDDKASRLGAALAYYTIFAIGPLILVAVVIAGYAFGEEAASGQIVGSIQGVVGADGAKVIQDALTNANKQSEGGIISTVVGIVTLMLAAGGLFGQLQDSLNTIWGVKAKPNGIVGMIRERLLTFAMVIGTGVLLLGSLLVNAALSLVQGSDISNAIPGSALLWQIINYVVSFGLITLVFAIIYRVLPDVHIRWSDVWVGAGVTSVLFLVGQILLGIYFSFSDPGSPYGAAGSLVLILVWIFYTAQIVFFGAEFTQVYANKFGSDVRPSENGEWVSAAERAKQGLEGQKEHKKKADRIERGEPAEKPRIPRFYTRPEREPLPETPVVASSTTAAPPASETAKVVGAALIPVAALGVVRLLSGGGNDKQ